MVRGSSIASVVVVAGATALRLVIIMSNLLSQTPIQYLEWRRRRKSWSWSWSNWSADENFDKDGISEKRYTSNGVVCMYGKIHHYTYDVFSSI